MDKIILFTVLLTFQQLGLVWGTSYLIELQNGNELRTSYYWEEGDEIKFYIYGGVAGVQKSFVTKVAISNMNYKEDEKKSQILSDPTDLKASKNIPAQMTGRDRQVDKKTDKKEMIDFGNYRERKAALKEKLEEALQRNREASLSKDVEGKELSRQEYLEYSRQIIELGEELKQKNNGVLPDWWEE